MHNYTDKVDMSLSLAIPLPELFLPLKQSFEFELRIPVSTADMNRLLAHEAGTQAYLLQGPVSSTHVDILPRMTADRAAYQGLQPDARNIAVTACAPLPRRAC